MVINPTFLAQRTRQSVNWADAKRRVLHNYRSWIRAAPEIQSMYSLNMPVSAIRTKMRQEFERHRYVNQIGTVDVLLFQSHSEFQVRFLFDLSCILPWWGGFLGKWGRRKLGEMSCCGYLSWWDGGTCNGYHILWREQRYVTSRGKVYNCLLTAGIFLQETLNYWKQLPHVLKYFRVEEEPSAKLPKDFMSGFLEGRN
ncbi:hypothetical protein F5884DRAFT_97984 [Xylogone sp. PMI_703]|nr:hypothetical protein F5884DRAFT_97984 [Xylogone sp. PMI_703]